MGIIDFVNVYGLPITVAGGMGYFIFFIWKFVTTQIKPKLGSTATVLIALIDRIRMLDNDLIRLNAKLDMIIQQKEEANEIKSSDITIGNNRPRRSSK